MRHSIYVFLIFAVFVIASCSKPMGRYERDIDVAERLIPVNADSALAILEAIDPAELSVDSIKAKYFYVLASAHDHQDHFAFSDSMLSFANDYYRDKDLKHSIRSTTLLATYRFRIGQRDEAVRMLDSLTSLQQVPDSLLIEPLRKRIHLLAYDGDNEWRIRRLMSLDNDGDWQQQYKFWLFFTHLFNDKSDSALVVIDELIDRATEDGDPEQRLVYKYERMGALMELGKYGEVLDNADSLLNSTAFDSGAPYFHLWKSLALLNMGEYRQASAELALSDSLMSTIPAEERGYFSSFATVVQTVLNHHNAGKISFIPLSRIYNVQRDNLFEAQLMQQEAATQALETENQRLILKAKNERQTALLIITVLAALLISGLLVWYAVNKKRKAVEVLERNEILQKLVDESNATDANSTTNGILRKVMLQHLGVIKMVAETPTEQNRDMLRKISSVEDGVADGSLVNWESVYGIIDNLYAGFYSRLHKRYGAALTDKEERIIALMVAGFSTKEISVITGQTVATIYVRKTSVRKKIGVPEKEDIVTYLRQQAHD